MRPPARPPAPIRLLLLLLRSNPVRSGPVRSGRALLSIHSYNVPLFLLQYSTRIHTAIVASQYSELRSQIAQLSPLCLAKCSSALYCLPLVRVACALSPRGRSMFNTSYAHSCLSSTLCSSLHFTSLQYRYNHAAARLALSPILNT